MCVFLYYSLFNKWHCLICMCFYIEITNGDNNYVEILGQISPCLITDLRQLRVSSFVGKQILFANEFSTTVPRLHKILMMTGNGGKSRELIEENNRWLMQQLVSTDLAHSSGLIAYLVLTIIRRCPEQPDRIDLISWKMFIEHCLDSNKIILTISYEYSHARTRFVFLHSAIHRKTNKYDLLNTIFEFLQFLSFFAIFIAFNQKIEGLET